MSKRIDDKLKFTIVILMIFIVALRKAICFILNRDAWSLGAIDPTSGTATLLEITRVLGEMYRNGLFLIDGVIKV